jgi:hypothetical protein
MATGTIINSKKLDWDNAVTISTNTYTPSKPGMLFAYGATTGSSGYVAIMNSNRDMTCAMGYFPSTATRIGCECFAESGVTYQKNSYNASITFKFVPFS